MDVDIIAGYLGAGKTTCILEMIQNDPDPSRLAVLVNEFGDVGIDAALLGEGTEVVELASGCICCTLRLDFRTQIGEIVDRWHPLRLLIEPTGVATVAQVVRSLRHSDLADKVGGARVFVLVDAVTFTERLRESPQFFTSQVRQADVLLLNKIDLVSRSRTEALRAVLESLNPEAWIISTVNGRIGDGTELPAPHPLEDPGDAEVLAGLGSLSYAVDRLVGRREVRELFEGLGTGLMGRVERAKAIVETVDGWYRFDLASGRVDERPWGPAPSGRLVVIGTDLSNATLDAAVRSFGGK
ncbi:MAG: CobW family GTP-binding protein [Thermoleophilia bacterium]